MIIWKDIKRGFTFRPFIFLPKWLAVQDPVYQKAYLLHEQVHWKQQKFPFNVAWVLRYYSDKGFRWKMEKEGFEVEIRTRLEGGDIFMDKGKLFEYYKKTLMEGYNNMVSEEECRTFLTWLIGV